MQGLIDCSEWNLMGQKSKPTGNTPPLHKYNQWHTIQSGSNHVQPLSVEEINRSINETLGSLIWRDSSSILPRALIISKFMDLSPMTRFTHVNTSVQLRENEWPTLTTFGFISGQNTNLYQYLFCTRMYLSFHDTTKHGLEFFAGFRPPDLLPLSACLLNLDGPSDKFNQQRCRVSLHCAALWTEFSPAFSSLPSRQSVVRRARWLKSDSGLVFVIRKTKPSSESR